MQKSPQKQKSKQKNLEKNLLQFWPISLNETFDLNFKFTPFPQLSRAKNRAATMDKIHKAYGQTYKNYKYKIYPQKISEFQIQCQKTKIHQKAYENTKNSYTEKMLFDRKFFDHQKKSIIFELITSARPAMMSPLAEFMKHIKVCVLQIN